MMTSAENWLRDRGAPKLNVMVREENASVAAFYNTLGYALEPRLVFGKWLANDKR
jgi:hypothetical protein